VTHKYAHLVACVSVDKLYTYGYEKGCRPSNGYGSRRIQAVRADARRVRGKNGLSSRHGEDGGISSTQGIGPPTRHAPPLREGDGRERQGFGVGENAMRWRYRSRLLWTATLGTVAAFAGLAIFMSVPRPPQEVSDLLEKLQLGMDRVEVEDVMGYRPGGRASDPPWGVSSHAIGDSWIVHVELGQDGKLIHKEAIAPPNPPLWRRAWHSLQQRIPSLPDLPL
jgi:hypothetical protein